MVKKKKDNRTDVKKITKIMIRRGRAKMKGMMKEESWGAGG